MVAVEIDPMAHKYETGPVVDSTQTLHGFALVLCSVSIRLFVPPCVSVSHLDVSWNFAQKPVGTACSEVMREAAI